MLLAAALSLFPEAKSFQPCAAGISALSFYSPFATLGANSAGGIAAVLRLRGAIHLCHRVTLGVPNWMFAALAKESQFC
jgi:phage tail tape-measure protein